MPPPRLLISVRNAAEARAALAGGADIIDVKDPAAGPLGRAIPQTIDEVIAAVDGACPVTAALGELVDDDGRDLSPHVAFAKLGLARAPGRWRNDLTNRAAAVGPSRFVAAAYADHSRVAAPLVGAVLQWAIRQRVAGLLIDTALKDGRGLLHWCEPAILRRWIDEAHRAGLFVALAGALTPIDLARCRGLGADVIAVRGAACEDQQRDGAVDPRRVADLKALLAAGSAVGPVAGG